MSKLIFNSPFNKTNNFQIFKLVHYQIHSYTFASIHIISPLLH